MRTLFCLIIVIILSGCDFRNAFRLNFGDWSPQAALEKAQSDYQKGQVQIFYVAVHPNISPNMSMPLGIDDRDLYLVKNMPVDRLPCGYPGGYRSEYHMKLCQKQREYGTVYNKQVISILKKSDNIMRDADASK